MQCPICLTEGEEEKIILVLPCQHRCCLQCFASLKKFSCMMCRLNVEHLVPKSMKEADDLTAIIRYYAMINDNDFYLALLGSRLRRQILRARVVRRLTDESQVPLLLSYDSDD